MCMRCLEAFLDNSIHAPYLRQVRLVCWQEVTLKLSAKYGRARELVGINIPIQTKKKVFLFFTDGGGGVTMSRLEKIR